jgi:hypothetical protein
VCFGLDVDDTLLTKVEYTDEKIAVPFGAHLPKFGLSAELLTRIVSTKATAWSYEREYRVMGNLLTQDASTGLYYTDFGHQVQLREIVIGYRCTWSIATAHEMVGDERHSLTAALIPSLANASRESGFSLVAARNSNRASKSVNCVSRNSSSPVFNPRATAADPGSG